MRTAKLRYRTISSERRSSISPSAFGHVCNPSLRSIPMTGIGILRLETYVRRDICACGNESALHWCDVRQEGNRLGLGGGDVGLGFELAFELECLLEFSLEHCSDLLACRLEGHPAHACGVVPSLERRLGTRNPCLEQDPVSVADDLLHLLSLLQLGPVLFIDRLLCEAVEMNEGSGDDVARSSDDAVHASHHAGDDDVCKAAPDVESGSGDGRRHARCLADGGAGEFGAADVGVLGDLDELVRVEVYAADAGGEVVHHHRNG
ncbi:hypothetical protein L1887_43294 [Cichorium endivia]|nr:hypothetical protein L1887_43294 [Cichorium endivia]